MLPMAVCGIVRLLLNFLLLDETKEKDHTRTILFMLTADPLVSLFHLLFSVKVKWLTNA